MSGGRDGLAHIRAMCDRIRFERIESRRIAALKTAEDIAAEAHVRLQRNWPLDREQFAAVLGASTKKVQRLEAAGKIRRCSEVGSLVLYPASDVLRLLSAPRKER